MTAAEITFEEVVQELSELQAAFPNLSEGKAAALELVNGAGCKDIQELRDRNDAELYRRIVSDAQRQAEAAREQAGKSPRLHATRESILKFIRWQAAGKCSAQSKDDIYRAIAATEGLQPTEIEHLLKELKTKLPGSPPLAAIRKEFAALTRQTQGSKHPLPKDAELVIFRNHEKDAVYGGVSDPATGKFVPGLGLAELKGNTGIGQLCGMFGRAPLDPQQLPLGVFEFRPGETPQTTKTAAGYTINTWVPPALREHAEPSETVPPTIRRLLLHVLGGDHAVYEHFVNWLGVAYQTNNRTGTAWVIAGCPGTGKGLLFDEIITPLFGTDYCMSMTGTQLEDRFNEWFASCLMLDIDEAKISGFQAPQVEAALRIYITNPKAAVKRKHADSVVVDNHCNVILTSNDLKPINIAEGDRRYNVSPRQEASLESVNWLGHGNGEKLAGALRAELPKLAGYLAAFDIDAEKARRPLRTEERDKTIENSTTTPERIARALKRGDLNYFLEEFWTVVSGTDVFSRRIDAEDARKVLLGWARTANAPGAKRVTHINIPASHVAAIFNFLMPEKYKRTPQEIGRAIGLKANAWCNRGRAYRISWLAKETDGALADIIDRLECFGSVPEAEFVDSEQADERTPPAHSLAVQRQLREIERRFDSKENAEKFRAELYNHGLAAKVRATGDEWIVKAQAASAAAKDAILKAVLEEHAAPAQVSPREFERPEEHQNQITMAEQEAPSNEQFAWLDEGAPAHRPKTKSPLEDGKRKGDIEQAAGSDTLALFTKQLDVEPEFAQVLAAAGFSTIEGILAGESKLKTIEGLDEDIVAELVARARFSLEAFAVV